jgi:hypothetical protein
MLSFFRSWKREFGVVTLALMKSAPVYLNVPKYKVAIHAAAALALMAGIVQADDGRGVAVKDQSTEAMIRQLDSLPRSDSFTLNESTVTLEVALQELVRRGGASVEQFLQTKLRWNTEKLESTRKRLDANPQDDELRALVLDLEHNLDLLTALRRVEHQPDPLQLVVRPPEAGRAGTRRLPVLDVALKNADVEKLPIGFHIDRRTGAPEHWRIHVWDRNGNLLPSRKDAPHGKGGQLESLPFGESWETELNMSDYVDIRLPGEYKVQVLYHEEFGIADIEDVAVLDRLIVFKSVPFALHLEHGPNITIELQPGSMQKALALVEKLDGNQKLRMVIGDYTDKFHKFLDPKSAQGELRSMGWQAVPAMLDSLADDSLPFRKRAWLLTLLYSITEERDFDPRRVDGILPNCEWRQTGGSGWRGYLFDRYSFDQNSIDKQREFARAWLRFREDYIVINSPD